MSRGSSGFVLGMIGALLAGIAIGVFASDRGMQQRISASTKQLGERVADGAQGAREKGEGLRDRTALNFGRAVFQAAEARDATLSAIDDLDDDTGSVPQQSDPSATGSDRAL